MRKCSVIGCKNVHHAKGLCSIHYSRKVRFGVTELPERKEKIMGVCINPGCEREAEEGKECKNCQRLKRRRENRKIKLNRRKPADICTVFGCYEPKYRKSMCVKHYQRHKKTGDVFSEEHVIQDFTLKEKLLFNVKLDRETRCWEWQGRKDPDGYGTLSVGDFPVRAHRTMYEVVKGPIPDGLLVCHKCDNPSCCNPEHLFLGTTSDNNKDKTLKGRTPKGEDSAMSILTEKNVIEIKALIKEGLKDQDIGDTYGVTRSAIYRIRCGKNWKHIMC